MENWRIIKDKPSYERAMERLLVLADSDLAENSAELDEFELLSLLVGHYEESHYQIDKPNPIEAIKFRMEQMGLSHTDMRQYLGSASKVSEVLSGKRKLSLSMIRRLHDGLGIPADILIQSTDDVEWSPVTYGAESFALAIPLTDVGLKAIESFGFVDSGPLGEGLRLSTKSHSFDVSSKINVAPANLSDFAGCF